MDAQQYVDHLRSQGEVLRLASFDEHGWCNGRGLAVVIDRGESMAMMLENCGRVSQTHITSGAIVKFQSKPDAEPRIVGPPAYPHPAGHPIS